MSGTVEHAARAGATVVDTDHVLLALLDRRNSRASFAPTMLDARDSRDAIERSLAAARRYGGLSGAEAEALAGLGIDLSEVARSRCGLARCPVSVRLSPGRRRCLGPAGDRARSFPAPWREAGVSRSVAASSGAYGGTR